MRSVFYMIHSSIRNNTVTSYGVTEESCFQVEEHFPEYNTQDVEGSIFLNFVESLTAYSFWLGIDAELLD